MRSEQNPYEPDLRTRLLRDRAVMAALGREPFDLVIENGVLADVATGELRPADVGLSGPLIASVHERGSRADAPRRIDARGKVVAPGLIDTHVHIESSMVTPRRYAETVVPQGTTTIAWDPHEIGNVLGLDGVKWAIEASRCLPLRVLVLAPSSVPSAPGLERAGASFGSHEIQTMLAWREVTGLAEVMDMRGVLERSQRMTAVVGEGLHSGKLVCGHARGLGGRELQAFVAAGIESDHEITSGDDLLTKVRAGMTIELRGSHDEILPDAVQAILGLPRMPQTLTVCTDDIFPDDLVTAGGIADVLRRLVRYGLPAIEALRAATFNAACRLGRKDLGLVAAGKRADLVLLEDLDSFAVSDVVVSGHHIASRNELLTALPPEATSIPTDTVHVPALEPANFRLASSNVTDGIARIRTVRTPRFTEWGEAEVAVHGGRAELPVDGLLMAVIHRHGKVAGGPGLGILQNWGEWHGAIATTVSHDSHNLVVFGRDARDMAAAANAVIERNGGFAVVEEGAVRASLPLPVCGLCSQEPTEKVAEGLRQLREAADKVAGWKSTQPIIKAIVGASLACNPGPHVTDLGVTDGSTGELWGNGLIL